MIECTKNLHYSLKTACGAIFSIKFSIKIEILGKLQVKCKRRNNKFLDDKWGPVTHGQEKSAKQDTKTTSHKGKKLIKDIKI